MNLWTLGALGIAARGRLVGGDPATPVDGVSIDSRTLAPGDAYFAIRGVTQDGHRFVPAALENGASVAVISTGEAERAIVVDDVLEALGHVGIAARARLAPQTPVIAVTGSVGKTGTKEMLRLAFAAGGTVHASEASYNNHWGVPLSLARMPADTAAAVFEIGMNHAGEILPLTRMVRPTIAIVTTVAAVHLEFFKDVAGIADAKAEIFAGFAERDPTLPEASPPAATLPEASPPAATLPDATGTRRRTAIIPSDNPHTARLAGAARAAGADIVTFGHGGDVTLVHAIDGAVEADVFGTRVAYRLGDPGVHVATNSLAVLAALAVAGRDVTAGAAALAQWTAPVGRGRRVPLMPAGAVLLDDWFNANPSSMGAAIAALGATPATRRVAILGDMLELGATAPELHRGLAALLIAADARIVHTVGSMTTHLRDALPADRRGLHAATATELVAALPPVAPGDAILVKGSKGIALGAVVDAIEQRFGQERDGV